MFIAAVQSGPANSLDHHIRISSIGKFKVKASYLSTERSVK